MLAIDGGLPSGHAMEAGKSQTEKEVEMLLVFGERLPKGIRVQRRGE